MSFAKIKTSKGVRVIQITTPEGKAYTFRRLSTKPLDPKLKADGKLRAKAMREGFQKTVKRAVKKGVPLQKLVPRQLKKPGPASHSGEMSGDQRKGAV